MMDHRRPNKRPRPQQVDSQLGPVIGDYTQAQEPMQLRAPRKRFDGVQAIKNALFAASGIILVGLVLFAIFMLAMAASSRRAHSDGNVMGQISAKLRRGTAEYFWFCPACDELHPLPDGWKFDGNRDKPTFSPSFKHDWNWGPLAEPPKRPGHNVCHYIVTAGRVAYCGDCTHSMAGQTIDMPDLPELYRDDRGDA